MAAKSTSDKVRAIASKKAADMTAAERTVLREAFLAGEHTLTVTIEVDGSSETFTVDTAKTFGSGSVGFYLSARVRGKSGLKYLANIPVTVVGTKGEDK